MEKEDQGIIQIWFTWSHPWSTLIIFFYSVAFVLMVAGSCILDFFFNKSNSFRWIATFECSSTFYTFWKFLIILFVCIFLSSPLSSENYELFNMSFWNILCRNDTGIFWLIYYCLDVNVMIKDIIIRFK